MYKSVDSFFSGHFLEWFLFPPKFTFFNDLRKTWSPKRTKKWASWSHVKRLTASLTSKLPISIFPSITIWKTAHGKRTSLDFAPTSASELTKNRIRKLTTKNDVKKMCSFRCFVFLEFHFGPKTCAGVCSCFFVVAFLRKIVFLEMCKRHRPSFNIWPLGGSLVVFNICAFWFSPKMKIANGLDPLSIWACFFAPWALLEVFFSLFAPSWGPLLLEG